MSSSPEELQYSARQGVPRHPRPTDAWDSQLATAWLGTHPSSPRDWPTLLASQHRPPGYPTWQASGHQLTPHFRNQLSMSEPRNHVLSPNSRDRPRDLSNHSTHHRPPSLPSTLPRISIDYRDLEYIQPYSQNLVCPICHVPFITPVKLSCDHIFCRDCLFTAMEHQPQESRSCPFCRAYATVGDIESVPQLINNMLDELRVQCPLKSKGCSQVIFRGVIEQHVAHYCEYAEVDCPEKDCRRKIERKHANDGRCRHKLIKCAGCEEDVVELSLSEHQATTCQAMAITCPDCAGDMLRSELSRHSATCAEARVPCSAAPYGCKFTGKVQEIDDHHTTCPIRMLGPFLDIQTSRLDAQETRIKHLEQQNSVYRACFAALEDMLDCDLLAESSSSDRDQRPRTGEATHASMTSGAHIIAHIDSLREELQEQFEQVTQGIADLEARQNTMVLNENLRHKDELSHVNAALANMRLQVQWLMNSRQHMHGPIRRGSLAQRPESPGERSSALRRPGPSREPSAASSTTSSVWATSDASAGSSREMQRDSVGASAGSSRDAGNFASSTNRQDPKL